MDRWQRTHGDTQGLSAEEREAFVRFMAGSQNEPPRLLRRLAEKGLLEWRPELFNYVLTGVETSRGGKRSAAEHADRRPARRAYEVTQVTGKPVAIVVAHSAKAAVRGVARSRELSAVLLHAEPVRTRPR
jgi:hypothetical protein